MARGGRISLTAFEAEWLRMHLDTTGSEAVEALPYLDGTAPKRVTDDPSAAWDRIIDKVSVVAGRAALAKEAEDYG